MSLSLNIPPHSTQDGIRAGKTVPTPSIVRI
jgi:hypothetical protein